MKKIVKMEDSSWLWNGYYPLKKQEIIYQQKIERALKANGLSSRCWWNCFERDDSDGQIFMRLFEMYQDCKDGDFMIKMFEYYDRIKLKVDTYIEREVATI